jgi:hypothetical protein
MPTVIDVVNSDIDWAAVAGAGATAIAAVGGIWGTARQARRAREAAARDLKESLIATTENLQLGIRAEDDRARRAEKRRIYASCLAAINAAIPALVEDRAARSSNDRDQRSSALKRAQLARTIMLNAAMELELIAPDSVLLHSRDVVAWLTNYWTETGKGAKIGGEFSDAGGSLDKLRTAMRTDLGEQINPLNQISRL